MLESPLRQRFGAHIRDLRIAAGLTQEAFADRCGLAQTYVSRIENGGANPSLDAMQILADALRVQLPTLFTWREDGAHQENAMMREIEELLAGHTKEDQRFMLQTLKQMIEWKYLK